MLQHLLTFTYRRGLPECYSVVFQRQIIEQAVEIVDADRGMLATQTLAHHFAKAPEEEEERAPHVPTVDLGGIVRDERIAVHQVAHPEQGLHGLLGLIHEVAVVLEIVDFHRVVNVVYWYMGGCQRFAKQDVFITIGADATIERMIEQGLFADHKITGAETLVGLRQTVFNGEFGQAPFLVAVAEIAVEAFAERRQGDTAVNHLVPFITLQIVLQEMRVGDVYVAIQKHQPFVTRIPRQHIADFRSPHVVVHLQQAAMRQGVDFAIGLNTPHARRFVVGHDDFEVESVMARRLGCSGQIMQRLYERGAKAVETGD